MMKKKLLKCLMLISFICLIACQSQLSTGPDQAGLWMDNLQSPADNMVQALKQALPDDNVQQFLAQTEDYYQSINTSSLVSAKVWAAISKKAWPYETGHILESWQQTYPTFPGFNCRLTTFTLLQGQISAKSNLTPDTSLLFVDEDALAQAPQSAYQFNADMQNLFKILYGAVATQASST